MAATIPPEGYEGWQCDFCTASCTFEAMEWCTRRRNPDAECGYDNDPPLALDKHGVPSTEGCFEFVQLKLKETVKYRGKTYSSVAEHVKDTLK